MRCLFFLAALLAAESLPAQSISSSIVGSVRDPSGLSVPGARVTLTQVATGVKREISTSQQGDFVFSTLPAAEYSLMVVAGGFKTLEKLGIMLSASETLSVGALELTVGGTVETVTVTAQGSSVQTASSERSGTIVGSQVENLLIVGRNVMDLLDLMPGVVNTSGVNNSLASENYLNVQGNSQRANNVLMDGVSLADTAWSLTMNVYIPMDTVNEVRVLLSNYQAEYGRYSGANISVITKSGTRDFHGLGSYFKRHEQFNANNFFNNRNAVLRPRYRFNTWTYNLGGPIFVPNRFNQNRDKLFFFWSQEYWPMTIPDAISQLTVPTELERQGDFSQTLDLNGKLIPITDPTTGTIFPGNRLPPDRIDSNGRVLLKLFPTPNFLDRSISKGNYNYIYQGRQVNPKRSDTLKVDYNANSSNLLSFSFRNRLERNKHTSNVLTSGTNWPQIEQTFNIRAWVFSGHYQRIFSPTLINELILGFWTRPEHDEVSDSELGKNQRDKVGFTVGQLFPAANPLNMIPNASFGGVPNAAALNGIGGRFLFRGKHPFESIADNVTKTIGSHTVRGGFYGEWDQRTGWNSAQFNGSFDFSRDVNNPLDTNYAYSNSVLGVFSTYTEPSAHLFYHAREHSLQWYLQDNWRAARRLTLDYGMRFYWQPPWVERDLRMSGFVPARFDPARRVSLISPGTVDQRRVGVDRLSGQIYPAVAIGGIAPGSGDPANGMLVVAENPSLPRGWMENWGVLLAPRAGFSFDPFGKGQTAIRGGFGIFYQRQDIEQWNSMTVQNPVVKTPTIYYGTLATLLKSQGILFPPTVYGLDGSSPAPTIMNFSLSVQQQVSHGIVVDVGYVGSLGRHLMWTRNLNAIPFGADFDPANADPTSPGKPLSAAFLRPVIGYGDIRYQEDAGSSIYHSMQVTARRRFVRGVQFGAAWTWSKALEYSGTVTSLVARRVWNYGLASADRTQVLKFDWMWQVPKTPWNNVVAKTVLNNWQLSGITSFISGAPLSVGWSTTYSTDITGTPTQNARIVVTSNPVLPKSQRTFSHFFDTGVFQMPAKGTWGNAASTSIRGPGINNWDFAVFKSFPISDRAFLQFRSEMYNAFNHTQFSGVNTSARFDAQGNQVNASFGEFTAARSPRLVQFGLRFNF
jgi:hypothetical protein